MRVDSELKTYQESSAGISRWPLRFRDVVHVEVDGRVVDVIQGYLTPVHLLMQTEFGEPNLISPLQYPNFDALVRAREEIRTLQLLPVKTQNLYEQYKAIPTDALAGRVAQILGDDVMVLAPNEHPHDLSADVWQGVIWMSSDGIPEREVATFIARSMQLLDLHHDDFISFRRPPAATAKLTRPTMPGIPHVHFWTRK